MRLGAELPLLLSGRKFSGDDESPVLTEGSSGKSVILVRGIRPFLRKTKLTIVCVRGKSLEQTVKVNAPSSSELAKF